MSALVSLVWAAVIVVAVVLSMLVIGWVVIRGFSLWTQAMDDVSVDDEIDDPEEVPHGL